MTHPKPVFPKTYALLALLFCLPGVRPAAQTMTFEPADLSEKPTLFQIGYSHLDTEWRWGYPQVIREFLPNTVRENLPLFEKYPHYVLNFTGAGRYKLIQEYHPGDFQKIRDAVAAGHWWPNGGAWEESDVNVPSSESLVRQLLLGHHYFMREFGVESSEFMLPDCFGFPASLPSILAHCGMRGFSTQKLSWGSAVGIPFNVGEWIGPDGNSVIAALNGGGYTAPVREDPAFNPAWLKRITENGEKSGVYADFIYMGAGDRGGAPRESSVALLEQGVLADDGPVRVISARADAMFLSITDAQRARLPKFTGDMLLTEHSAGSITSQAYMKRWNRQNELLADAAERASVIAALLGAAPYPREKINRAWELMLRTQMHDILPGTSLPKVYEYAWNDEVVVMNTFAEVLTGAVGAIAAGLDTRAAGGVPLVIYNPLSIAREDAVEATVTLPATGGEGVQVYDDAGKPVPTQLLSRDGDKARVLFLAKAPPVGLVVYSAKPAPSAATADTALKAGARTLENARYRVTLNDAGDVAGIFDKHSSCELLASPARLVFLDEKPAKYPAWNMDWEDRRKPPRGCVDGKANIDIVENGPVRVALRVRREAQGSAFAQTIRLVAGDGGGRIEIVNTIDWRSKGCSLKAEFPLTVSNPRATYNWGLGKVERGNNDEKKYEVPSHQWFDLTHTDGSRGVSILTGAKYGSDKPADDTVRLTLLYSPDTGKAKTYLEQRWQDWGRHEFTYGIHGHAGDWREGGADWQALRMEQPMLAFTTAAHEGKLGRSFSLLEIDSKAVAVRAIKMAESGNRVVVRLQELNGTPQDNVRLSTTAITVTDAEEINGLEKNIGTLAGGDGAALPLTFKKYQMRSLAFTPGEPRVRLDGAVSTPVVLPYNLNGFGYRGSSANGNFDGEDGSLPGEMMGGTVTSEGIVFNIGPHLKAQRKPNIVRCEGQVIRLPEGKYNRVYLLAAAVRGDATGAFTVGNATTTLTIQNWNGYVGQWDNRVFKGKVEELTYSVKNDLERIDAGFIKRDPLAWYCDHYYQFGGKDAIYSYSYLYKYALDVPAGATTLTLPKNPRIRVVAVTAALDPAAGTAPAQPLYDDFTNRTPIALPEGWANAR
jgi:alpha-mannosidase